MCLSLLFRKKKKTCRIHFCIGQIIMTSAGLAIVNINPLALELDIQIVAHHLCKM